MLTTNHVCVKLHDLPCRGRLFLVYYFRFSHFLSFLFLVVRLRFCFRSLLAVVRDSFALQIIHIVRSRCKFPLFFFSKLLLFVYLGYVYRSSPLGIN